MSDVDDELLALVGGGSSSSRASSPEDGARRKRRRSPGSNGAMTNGQSARRRNRREDDEDDEDEHSNSDDDDESRANPFPIDGIYKDQEDRERLLDMPELEREDELARRRDIISQRRQKAELAAMVRSQQMAGQRSVKRGQPAAKKQRRLKKASSSASKSRRKRADDDDDGADDFAESDEDDDDDAVEEEEEESDFEVSRRKGSRANQRAQLDKLKKRRAKARGGADSDEESTAESSGYSEGEMEELTRRKEARVRQMKGGRSMGRREDTKPSREEERVRTGGKKELPTLDQVNAARIRRDHFTRLVHRPEWTDQLTGRFARVIMNLATHANARPQNGYRMVLIGNGHASERYYELGDQYTNMVYTMYYGEAKYPNMPLSSISNSPVSQDEYERWLGHVEGAGEKVRRNVPSRELTLDRAEELEEFINRPFTEKDINEMIAAKRQARAAYEEYRAKRQQQQPQPNSSQQQYGARGQASATAANGANGASRSGPVDEHTLAEMNERHRRADRERIAEAERRSQQLRRQASQQHSRPASQPGSQPVTAPGSPRVKATNVDTKSSQESHAPKPGSGLHANPIIAAALDIDIDLGDF